MTTESRLSRREVEKLTLTQIVDDDRVKERFIMLFNARNKTVDGMAMYVQATESFMRAVQEDTNLQQCTPLSLYNAFLDMAYYGLTVSKQAQPLAYLLWNNVKAGGTKEKPAYEKRAHLAISPYGELAIRQNMGQIAYAENPVVVYEEDEYSGIYVKGGVKMVDYKKNMKSKNRRIIAAFVKLVRTDGTVDFVEMDMAQIKRLAGYSDRKNFGKGANALYSSNDGQIDEGFLVAKLIKHAFKAYPKVSNPHTKAVFETEKEVEDVQDIYGLDDEEQKAEQQTTEPVVEDAVAEEVNEESNEDSF